MLKSVFHKAGGFFLIFFLALTIVNASPIKAGGNYSTEEGKKHELSLALGYVSFSGNAQSETGSLKVRYAFVFKKLFIETKAYYIFNDITDISTGETNRTDEKYSLAVKTNYKMGKKSGVFTNLSWYKNKPAGINQNLSVAGGYSKILVDTDKKKGKLGIGVEGYKEEKIIEDEIKTNSSLAAYFEFGYELKFNDANKLKFENESRMNLSDSEDYRLENNLTYSSAINKKIAIEFNYIHQYKNLPVPGKKKTDTTTMINVVFRF